MELRVRYGKCRSIYRIGIILAMFIGIIFMEAICENLGVVGIVIWGISLAFVEMMYDTGFLYDRNMKIETDDEKIEICYNKTNIIMEYEKIKSVVLVTYCGRDYSDEFHRVRIITKGKRYTFYCNSDEEYGKIPYEQTDLAKLYQLLKSKGVNCC